MPRLQGKSFKNLIFFLGNLLLIFSQKNVIIKYRLISNSNHTNKKKIMKNKRLYSALTAFIAGALLYSPAQAQELPEKTSPDYLSMAVGMYDVADEDTATSLRLEYRSGTPVYFKDLHAWGGAMITTDYSIWAGGGLMYDLQLTDSLYAAPSFGLGYYSRGSSDKDLDFPIEFRSQLEVGYQFPSEGRIGISYAHFSNGGLSDHNPGTESVNLYYHVPLNSLAEQF